MATIVATASGGTRKWSDTATWSPAQIPTAADDVQLTSGSGAVTIDAGAVCRSLDCTGYAGTVTHLSSVTLTIGDATAGAGSVALKLVSGMTYSLGSTTTSALSFVSTSATRQTIATGGKTLGNWTINAPGGNYQLADSNTTGTSALVTLTAGTLDTNGQTCSWGGFNSSNSNTRTLTLGASSISLSTTGWSCATATGLTFTAGTSTITFNGATGTSMNAGSNLAYNNVVFANSGTATFTATGGVGTGTVANLTRTGTAAKTDDLRFSVNMTVTGTLTLAGNSVTNRVLVRSNIVGTARTITVNGTVAASNVDLQDVTAAGSASWDLSAASGGSGDCQGNTGITFTASTAQTWSGTSGGNWSANAWTSRVPLPQDDVTINAAFSASQTVTMDMPRLGRDVNWTGASGSPTWAITSTAPGLFGSLTLAAGVTISGTGSAFTFLGRGSRTITTNGVAFPGSVTVNAGTGTYTLQDALTLTTGTLTVGPSPDKGGTFNTNGQTVTCPLLAAGNSTGGTTLTLGTSTINLTSTAADAVFTATSGGSPANAVSAGSSTIIVTNASTSDRNIVAQGFALGTVTYTVAGSTGRLVIGTTGSTGTVTIGTLNFSDTSNARGLRLIAGITLAITGAFNVNGFAGNLVTVDTSTATSAATLSKPSGLVSCDYLSIRDSTAGGGAKWYAGANSTSVSNNSGWIFSAPPAVVTLGSFLLV